MRMSPVYLTFLSPRSYLLRQIAAPDSTHYRLTTLILLFSPSQQFFVSNCIFLIAILQPPFQHFVPSVYALTPFFGVWLRFVSAPPVIRSRTAPGILLRYTRCTFPSNFCWAWLDQVLSKSLHLLASVIARELMPCFHLAIFWITTLDYWHWVAVAVSGPTPTSVWALLSAFPYKAALFVLRGQLVLKWVGGRNLCYRWNGGWRWRFSGGGESSCERRRFH